MKCFPVLFWLFVSSCLSAQDIQIKAYVFEGSNRGFVQDAEVFVKETMTQQVISAVKTDEIGECSFSVPMNADFEVTVKKIGFRELLQKFNTKNSDPKFLKLELQRTDGYMFDITLAEERAEKVIQSEGISGAQIEVYNRTQGKEELVLMDYPKPNFNFFMEKGNHYTFLIRKEEYLAKRIEAFVNVEGCILCIDGVSDVAPGVTDNISATGYGTLLGNIELAKVGVGKSFEIKNINYDYDKSDIRPDAAKILDNVVNVFTDNPELELELGSHTDSRGSDDYNLNLSEKRARSATDYLMSKEIDQTRISYRGYGESEIKNKCKNGVACSDKEHEVNRRTELKITGIRKKESSSWKSLSRLITEEEFQKEMFKDLPAKASPSKTPKKHNGPAVFDSEDIFFLDTVPMESLMNKEYKYIVIAGSYLISSSAEKQKNRLKKMGFLNAKKEIFTDSEYHSVIVDSFNNENDANSLVRKLKAKKQDAFIKKIEIQN